MCTCVPEQKQIFRKWEKQRFFFKKRRRALNWNWNGKYWIGRGDKDLHMTLKTASPANVQRLGLYTYDNTHNERFQLGSQALFTNTIILS